MTPAATPHGLVVARFRPDSSARFWLSSSAQLAAAQIPCSLFWAIWFNLFETGSDDDYANTPGLLCVVSPSPSEIPIPDASFTLGPTYATSTHEYSNSPGPGGAQLTAIPAVECPAETLHQPLYLHTAPVLPIAGADQIPLKAYYHVLDNDSFYLFRKAALANRNQLLLAWIENRRAEVAQRLPQHVRELQSAQWDQWPLFGANENPDPTYMFGERNNPRRYHFDFIEDDNLPPPHQPLRLYIELFLYAQICKDYRWHGVEETIGYVREARADVHGHHNVVQPSDYDDYDINGPSRGQAQLSLAQDVAFRTQLAEFSAIAAGGYTELIPVSESWSDDRTRDTVDCTSQSGDKKPDDGGSPRVYLRFLPFAYPYLPASYPRVPMPSFPQVIVLDMFGVILDRERAIRDGLEPWLPPARLRHSGVSEAVKLYIEHEALAARSQRDCATSLPLIVHTALDTLASKLGVAVPLRAAFRTDATACILHPQPYDDALQAIERLSRQGRSLVVLSPFPLNTLDAVRPALSSNVRFFPVAIPLHAPVPATAFTQLRRWCQHVIRPLPARCSRSDPRSFAASDVLVVSGGMGRVLAPAAADGHPTVLIRRPEGVECNVAFVVGIGSETPHPSAVVGGLAELCAAG